MNKYRVALVSVNSVFETLAIGYLSAVLEETGYSVGRFDLQLSHAKTYEIVEPQGLTSQEESIFESIIEFHPFFIGFSLLHQIFGLYFLQYGCERVKKRFKSIHISCGGHYATFNGRRIMSRYPLVDSVVQGEGEKTIVELLSIIRSNNSLEICKGLLLRDVNGEIRETPHRPLIDDLDKLPFPSRNKEAILSDSRYSLPIISSRGCTGSCTFCDQPGINRYQQGKRWRGRSIKALVDEIEHYNKEYQVKFFTIVDSSFEDPSPKIGFPRIQSFAEEILSRKLRIRYYANFRAESFTGTQSDYELMHLLIQSGLAMVFVGIESFLARDLALYNKRSSVEQNINCLNFFRSFPISLRKGLIMFTPYSTIEDLRTNHSYMKEFEMSECLRHFLMQLAVFSGTEIIDILRRDGLLDEDKLHKSYYCYKFVDRRVLELASAVRELTIRAEIKSRWVQTEESSLMVHNLRAAYGHLIGEQLDRLGQTNYNISKRLADINDSYFENCLKLAENGWDHRKYNEIERHYIEKQFIPVSDELVIALNDFVANLKATSEM